MIGLLLCLAAFAIALIAGRRSLVAGICAVLSVGYLYGIVRANVLQTFTHFFFDAAVVGLFVAQLLPRLSDRERVRLRPITGWLIPLVGWPLILTLVPIQDPLIQLVGLRAAIFMLPFVLLGARLTNDDMLSVALWCAGLNVFAFVVGVAEFFIGVDRFFPRN